MRCKRLVSFLFVFVFVVNFLMIGADATEYGKFTVGSEEYGSVTLDKAKMEDKTVLVSTDMCIGSDAFTAYRSSYQEKQVHLITVSPDCKIVSGNVWFLCSGYYFGNQQGIDMLKIYNGSDGPLVGEGYGYTGSVLVTDLMFDLYGKKTTALLFNVPWDAGIHAKNEDGSLPYVIVVEGLTTAFPVFNDVSTDAYYADAVDWAVHKGITEGVSDTKFGPYTTCTRGHIITFLYRAVGNPEIKFQDGKNKVYFSDFYEFMDEGTWIVDAPYYFEAALWAYEEGIYTGTKFNASTQATRAEAIEYIWKVAGSPEPAGTNGFADVDDSASYAKAVTWAVENGVTNGNTETTFNPYGTCTRGQIVTFLYRAFA